MPRLLNILIQLHSHGVHLTEPLSRRAFMAERIKADPAEIFSSQYGCILSGAENRQRKAVTASQGIMGSGLPRDRSLEVMSVGEL
jgi:hypothetical protein